MTRQEPPRAKILGRLDGFFGRHVDVGPARIVLAGVQGNQVEAIKHGSDAGEVVPIARIPAEEDPPLVAFDDIALPQRSIEAKGPS